MSVVIGTTLFDTQAREGGVYTYVGTFGGARIYVLAGASSPTDAAMLMVATSRRRQYLANASPHVIARSQIAAPIFPGTPAAPIKIPEVVHAHTRFDRVLAHGPGRSAKTYFVPQVGTLIPARGITTAASLVLEPVDGMTVTYTWQTDIIRSRSGLEHRIATNPCPREDYTFSARLDDGAIAALQSALVQNQALAGAFGVALMHESLGLTAPGAGVTINVATTGLSDWCEPGQTAIVMLPDLTYVAIVVQSYTATTITADVNVGAFGVLGARVMPVIPCYLDDTQTFGLYPANAGTYTIKARSTYFGNASGAWSPRGSSITTWTDAFSHSLIVWDRRIKMEDGDTQTSPRATIGGTIIVDQGGVLDLVSVQPVTDFQREIQCWIYSDADRQFVKTFFGATFGQQVVFGLPTWKPDLVLASGDASGGTLIVLAPPTANTADYMRQWFLSPAQQQLQLLMSNGTVAYVRVTDVADLFNGTQELQLDISVTGTIAMISFLETARFDVDAMAITYNDDSDGNTIGGDVGVFKAPCRVVQQ